MNRIILVYPGGQLTLQQYKKVVPAQLIINKMHEFAHKYFDSFEKSDDPEFPAIESEKHNAMIISVTGPSGTECYL